MQIKKYKFKVALLSAIFFLSGCSQSFLDTTPEGSIPVDNFYKTDADAKGAVLGVYDILQSMYAYDWDSMWMLKTLLSDEIYTGGGHRGDQLPMRKSTSFVTAQATRLLPGCSRCRTGASTAPTW